MYIQKEVRLNGGGGYWSRIISEMSWLSQKTQRAFDSLILGQRPVGREGWRLIFGRKLE